MTKIEELIADFVVNTALYTRACWALIDCPDFLYDLWGISSGISNQVLQALEFHLFEFLTQCR